MDKTIPSNSAKPIAVVTGASRGIGAATARLLVERGYVVCINYRSNTDAALSLLRELGDDEHIAVQADVSQEAQVERLFEEVDRRLGTVSALVNNAAVIYPQSTIMEMSAERINATLATNVTGAFLCARAAVKRMSTQLGGSGGAIVNVSSRAAQLGSANEYIDYAASKGALDTFTRGLANEVAAQGIRVNCVRPGFIYTDMHSTAGEPGRVDRLKSSVPLQRGGQPLEIAYAIAWLLSAEASYCTGSFINAAGGR
jgi:NAD(P)-dependent dehydrogenase (short-subunit alcohol dehydrogenase family)